MAVIFVFGSNRAGIHGKGAALTAHQDYGAVHGIGEGRTGDAYAIPTKVFPTYAKRQIRLLDIRESVNKFIEYALDHPSDQFLITRLGTGLAGYTDEEIGSMFSMIPSNCTLPSEWEKYKEK